ncbi:MAG TPA: hypothetical protein VHT25_13100 [Solirubrobacteraceae bacterium]|nr:hypothetical protein [Solirubrobacteraceae bacterium]
MTEKRREIDWSGAEVEHGTVVVALTGSASKDWSERFEGVAKLLGQGNTDWGEVTLTKKAIKVADLQPGAEHDLRHFLESVVVQVNSEFVAKVDEQAAEPDDPQAAQDSTMTDRLRSFSTQDELE